LGEAVITVLTIEERQKVANCCLACGRVLAIGDYPLGCGGDPDKHGTPIVGRGADVTWPGGKTFENLGAETVTFYSPAEKARYLRTHGIEEFVRHQPVPGSDQSPHTSRWVGVSQETLDGAKAMLERVGQSRGRDPAPQTLIERWVPATEVGVTTVRGRL
jgi:hypothetical protein